MKRIKAEIYPGNKFGRLEVVKEIEKLNHNRQFDCICECGKHIKVDSSKLLSKNTQSCGCLRKELITAKNITHGLTKHPLYHVWISMKGRCFNFNDNSYKNYGARGISICDEWMDFKSFYNWAVGNGYKKGLTIERNDVNGNYEPSNCTFIPIKDQSKNRRSNHLINHNGETKTLSQWARDLNVKRELLKDRIGRGWSAEKALTTPVKNKLTEAN